MNDLILLVDEDPLLGEVISEYLSAKGYQVDVAEDEEQALQLLKTREYLLALIDQGVRSSTTRALLLALRAADSRMPCLLLTNYSQLEKITPLLESCTADYLLKPFQLSELHNMIRKHL
ncbi:MAG TPA: response regulator [Candidatus Syntrophosphaera sp.]|nr:response regulator [Candidatus Syntrophosphaera sp.]